MSEKNVEVMEDILSENGRIALSIRNMLSGRHILSVNVMGAPGTGKTSVLKRIISRLPGSSSVIEGDVESDIDTKDLNSRGIQAFQINTMGGCHLDAPMISSALADFSVGDGNYLFIENIGNLICPAEFDIGEHLRMIICSAADGSDKPYKYPLAFERADAVIINKDDLLPYVDFDREFFEKGLRKLNKKTGIFSVSCKNDRGFEPVVEWLIKQKNLI
ncbi:MAG: hydrogenase nickel incorporation protein HypB [Brevinematales bacterium]|jgi:hydrogenase nickel incorporation protein HypB